MAKTGLSRLPPSSRVTDMFINMSVGFVIAAMVLAMLALNVFEPGILANVLYGFSILCGFIAFLGISEYIRWPSKSFFDKHSSAFLIIGNFGFIAGYFLSYLEPVFRFAVPGISLMASGVCAGPWCRFFGRGRHRFVDLLPDLLERLEDASGNR